MLNFSQLYLGIFSLFISFLSFLNIIYCYYFDLFLDIGSFFFIFLITLFFGSLIFFKKKNLKKTSIFEKILTVITGYLIIPILLAIPYYLILNNLSLSIISSKPLFKLRSLCFKSPVITSLE